MDNIFELNRIHGGLQLILRYPNGYGASIVQHENSYGGENNGTEFEVAAIEFEDDVNWSIYYDFSDIQGFLTLAEVKEIANKIKTISNNNEECKIENNNESEYCELVASKIGYLETKLENTKRMNADVIAVQELFPNVQIWIDYEINIEFAAKEFAEVKSMLKILAENGFKLKEFIKSDTNPAWRVQGANCDIRLVPRWLKDEDAVEEGATCKLVKVGEEVYTYPKYKLVCEKGMDND
jgi:hypothetical protein